MPSSEPTTSEYEYEYTALASMISGSAGAR